MIMTVRMLMENKQAEDVEDQTDAANDKNKLWVLDLLGLDETLNGVENNGQTKCN